MAAAGLALVPAAAQAAGDTSGANAAIWYLNQQREANGIPGFRSVDNSLATSWCPYEDQSPVTEARVLAGQSYPSSFTSSSSPWTAAPLHQVAMYDPLARSAGYATMQNASFDGGPTMPYIECMGFGNEADDPSTPAAYTFFSELGPNDVQPSITVDSEGPFAPQQIVGINQGVPTGPQPIFYLLDMGQVRADSWSLTDASTGQAVPNVQMVDSYKVQAAGYDPGLLWNNAVMVPPPLQAGNVYTGQAKFSGDDGSCLIEDFSFATLQSDGSSLGTHVPALSYHSCGGGGSSSSSSSSSTSHAARTTHRRMRVPHVVAHWRHGKLIIKARLRHGQRLVVKAAGRYVVTRRHRVRLHTHYVSSVTVWVTKAGASSAHSVVQVFFR